jgi:hypothetical protein
MNRISKIMDSEKTVNTVGIALALLTTIALIRLVLEALGVI